MGALYTTFCLWYNSSKLYHHELESNMHKTGLKNDPMQQHNSRRSILSAGFTLVEMAVIAPIVILLIGGFISLIVNLTGEVMSSRGSNILTYDLQDALNRIEQDIKLSSTFLSVNNINVATTKQGYGGTTTAGSTTNFTNIDKTPSGGSTASIILNVLLTDGNPLASDSGLVYLKDEPNSCSNYIEYSKNKPMSANVVYYIDSSNTLWRRMIMPDIYDDVPVTYCGSAPWQIPSCMNGYNAASLPFCKTNDEKLVEGVSPSDFKFEYHTTAGSTSPSTLTTDTAASDDTRNTALLSTPTLKIDLTANQTVAGRDITRSASLRATRLDSNASGIAKEVAVTSAPTAPVISSVISDGHIVKFTWPQVATATSYEASYRINGGAWLGNTTTIGNTNRSFVVSAGTHTDAVEIRVRSTNSFGSSSYASLSTKIPLWAPLLLKGSWSDYAGGYSPASYTKTKAGLVMLKGLIKKVEAATAGELIASLPSDYKPSGRLIFSTTTNSNVWGRVDIEANGGITMRTGNGTWFSLESVRYIADDAPYTPTTPTLLNSWTNYATSYAPASYVQDSTGRVNIQGLIAGGGMADGTAMFNLPASMAPPQYLHLPALGASANFSAIGVTTASSIVAKNVGTNGFQSINSSYIPSSAGLAWSNIPLQNGWVTYGGIYATPQYTKTSDGVVHLKGLVRLGTVTSGTVIGSLPAGFRPMERQLTTAANAASYADHSRFDILPNGQLVIQGVDGNGWYSFDGISFLAEQ